MAPSCFRSQTSTSTSTSRKSAERDITRMSSMLAPFSPTVPVMAASAPGSLMAVTAICAGNSSLRDGSMSQRTSSQRSGWSSKAVRAGDWIG